MKIKISLILFLLICSAGLKASDPRTIIAAVNAKFSQVKNYQTDVIIKTDIPFIKMLPVSATLYYKAPDKMRIKSKGIAILPKQGFDDLLKALADTVSYSALYQGEEIIRNIPVSIISIIPVSDTSDMILGKFWMDTNLQVAGQGRAVRRHRRQGRWPGHRGL